MKYCTKCGAQLMDEAMICLKCGCATGAMRLPTAEKKRMTGLQIAATVFMCINLFAYVFLIIGLAILITPWLYVLYIIPFGVMVPPMIIFESKVKQGQMIGVGLKVCILLLVSLIAGILLLCERDENEEYY